MTQPVVPNEATTPTADAARSTRARILSVLRNPVFLIGVATAIIAYSLTQGYEWGVINWTFGRETGRKPALPALVIISTFLALPIAYRYLRTSSHVRRALALLILVGVGVYWSHSFLEGAGFKPMSKMIWTKGHAEFLRIAQEEPPAVLVANYTAMSRKHKWRFARSKPPGSVLVYRGIIAAADSPFGGLVAPIYEDQPKKGWQETRDWRISGVMFTLLPFLTFLTIIPLYQLTVLLAGRREAQIAALLYAVVPVLSLVPMHLDGALYPLLGTSAAALMAWGFERRKPWMAAVSGLVLSAGVFVTFGLLAIVPVVALLPMYQLTREDGPWRTRVRSAAGYVGWFALGLVAFHLPLVAFLHYDPIECFNDAMQNHTTWWKGGGHNWVLGSPMQFAVWIGLPVAVAAVVGAFASLRREHFLNPTSLLLLATFVSIALTAWHGSARAEAQRLWIFFTPLLMVGAARQIATWEDRHGRTLVPAFIAMELATAVFIKTHFTF
ncbi:MAG: hypothetical protein F9K40_02705 [Kofleriaceae bacterium]|nr:MAG: hypothetical protein F9K40_02705 [Kofleriaceae bacterium]